MATLQHLTSVKAPKEAIDLQSGMGRSALETTMAADGKLTEALLKLSEQAMAPITARVTAAVETFAKAA